MPKHIPLNFTHGTWRHRCPGAINGRTKHYLWVAVPLGEACRGCSAADTMRPPVRSKFRAAQKLRHALTVKVSVEVPRDDVEALKTYAKELRDAHVERHTSTCRDDLPHVPMLRNKRLWCARCKTYL